MPNVLLVSLDTLRQDVAFSGKFPALERLRREGATFRRVVSSAPLTPISHASIFTGTQPYRHGIRHLLREQLGTGVVPLADRLRRAGYATGAVVSCPGLHRWYELDRGFQHYDDEIPPLPDGRDPLQVVDVKIRGSALKRAPLVVERSLAWVRDHRSQPFFLFAHFFDAHWPYEAPEDFAQAANPYEAEVGYMDKHLGLLLEGLEDSGVDLDEMLVVCLSDHGEDLGGWYADDHAGERGYPEEEGHGCLVFDVTQMVPLWFRHPGRVQAGLEVRRQVRLVDVAPTVLDLLGLPGGDAADGSSLAPYLGGEDPGHRLAYSETYYREELAALSPQFAHLRPLQAVRLDDRHKLVWEVGSGVVHAYDLVADPAEQNPLTLGEGASAPAGD